MNEDFSDGRPEGLPIMSRHYAAHGVTSFLATTMTLKEETLTPAMHAIRDFRRPADGASAPASTWRVPSCATPSGAPRRRRTCTSRTLPCSTASMRPAAAWSA